MLLYLGGNSFTCSYYPVHIPKDLGCPSFRDSPKPFLHQLSSSCLLCEKANPISSEEDLKVWKLHVLDICKAKYGHDFKFHHCYEFAQTSPKLLALFATECNSPRALLDPTMATRSIRKVLVHQRNVLYQRRWNRSRRRLRWWKEWQRSSASTAEPTLTKIWNEFGNDEITSSLQCTCWLSFNCWTGHVNMDDAIHVELYKC